MRISTLSNEFVVIARAERDQLREKLLARLQEVEDLEQQVLVAREASEELSRLIRDFDEILGDASQLSLHEVHDTLRGERLREIAVAVLRSHAITQPIHYREWFKLVTDDGYSVAGRDPVATFLTQVRRIDGILAVGRRTGLYRLAA